MVECIDKSSFFLKNSKLAGISWGTKNAPLWIALHGWMDNAATFTRIAPIIAHRLGIQVIAIDFSGHGHSRHRPPRSEYSLWSYCHDVLDILDELGNPKVVLLGHSLGAGVASIIAAVYPELVRGIVLIDGLLGRLVEPENLLHHLRNGISAQRSPTLTKRHYNNIEEAVAARIHKSILPITSNTARPIVIRSLMGGTKEGYQVRTDWQIKTPKPIAFTENQAVAILRNIHCLSLLIQGKQGIIPKRDENYACRKAIAGLTKIELEGGHHLHLETNSIVHVAEAIIAWTKSNSLLLANDN